MSKEEVIKLLKESLVDGYALADASCVQKAIKLLESEPEAGEFTKTNRDFIKDANRDLQADRVHGDCVIDYVRALRELSGACDRIDRLEKENKYLLDDVAQFNHGWEAAQKKEPFDEEQTDLWQQGWQIFDYNRLQSQLKAKDEALRIAKWTLFGCLAEKDDPEYKNFNVDEIVMGAKVCEQALKGEQKNETS